MEFLVVYIEEKEHMEIPGVNQAIKEAEFLGVFKKKWWNFHGSWFLNLAFPKGCLTILRNFLKQKLAFYVISNAREKSKNFKGAFRKSIYKKFLAQFYGWGSTASMLEPL